MADSILSDTAIVALIGALGGVLLGLAARLGRFCTLGAIEDFLYGGSSERLRMWGVAIGISILGVFGLAALGLFDPVASIYLQSRFNPAASIIGGLLFGYGMALAGNCGFGALARFGGGDLRAFVIILVMGISAFVALSGPLAALRVWLFPVEMADETPGMAHLLGRILGVAPLSVGLLIGAAILIASGWPGRKSRNVALWGSIVGIAIVMGWVGTYWVAERSFEAIPVVSHTFSAPLGETILFAMIASGRSISFGIGSVCGVVLGAFLGSLIKGHFRWEACDDPRELKRQIMGAVSMGFGAVIALGCTVGQGISAFSVLAFSAPLTFAAIFAGTAIGLRQLITGFSFLNRA